MFNLSVGLVVWAAILASWNVIMFLCFSCVFIGELMGLKKTKTQKNWQLALIKVINSLLNLIVLAAVIGYLPDFILDQLIQAEGKLINLLLMLVVVINVVLALGIYSLRIRNESLRDRQTVNVLLFPFSLCHFWDKWLKINEEEPGLDWMYGTLTSLPKGRESYLMLNNAEQHHIMIEGIGRSGKEKILEDYRTTNKMVLEVEGEYGVIETRLADKIKDNWPYPIDPFFTACTKQICTTFIQYIEFVYEKNEIVPTEEKILYELKEMDRVIREQELPVTIVLSIIKGRLLADNKLLKIPTLDLIDPKALQKTWDLLSFELQDTVVEDQNVSLVALEFMDE